MRLITSMCLLTVATLTLEWFRLLLLPATATLVHDRDDAILTSETIISTSMEPRERGSAEIGLPARKLPQPTRCVPIDEQYALMRV